MFPDKLKDVEYLTTVKENQHFDRKSARTDPSSILRHIIAFANAEGGYLVIGIEDDGLLTGFRIDRAYDIEDFEKIAFTELRDTPVVCATMTIDIINSAGEDDKVLIIEVPPSYNRIVKAPGGKVFLRVADKTRELNHSQFVQLQYDKGERYFEDEIAADSSLFDVDDSLIDAYKKLMKTPDISSKDLLNARGFLRDGKLTNAGVLLFAENPTKFLPQARLRFVRYEGSHALVGTSLNIVKERTFDGPIPAIISQATDYLATQFREFQYLDTDGQFKKMPEYPEFAWVEGMVNALTHRDYSIRGEHIKIVMFDDRLEISSPGALPNLVNVENIRYQRFSRNPRIARILSEFGWVKELNEGVKRIYSEMENMFLASPTYCEPHGSSVLLLLENNILSRSIRISDSLIRCIGEKLHAKLSKSQLHVLSYISQTGRASVKDVANLLKQSMGTARKHLKGLVEMDILEWHGTGPNDPTQYYALK